MVNIQSLDIFLFWYAYVYWQVIKVIRKFGILGEIRRVNVGKLYRSKVNLVFIIVIGFVLKQNDRIVERQYLIESKYFETKHITHIGD